jgi:hypothetical protein
MTLGRPIIGVPLKKAMLFDAFAIKFHRNRAI